MTLTLSYECNTVDTNIISISEEKQETAVDAGVPNWIKTTAEWWSKGQIDDADFVRGIEFLLNNNFIRF